MFLGFIVLAVIIYVKLKNSPTFDKFCKDLTSDDSINDSAKNKIKDIVSTEKDLSKKADINIKNAEKLKEESENINDFLDKRNKKEDS